MLVISCLNPVVLMAQTPTTDYKKAVSFLYNNLVNKKVFNANVPSVWLQDSSGVILILNERNKRTYHTVDFKTFTLNLYFDHERLAKLLSDSLHTQIKSNDLPLQNISKPKKDHFDMDYKGSAYHIDLKNYTVRRLPPSKGNELESASPDGKWIAYTKDYNLFIKSTLDGSIKQLSTQGKRKFEFGTYYGWSDIIEGEDGERPQRLSVLWSPDSKWIQSYICDLRIAKKMFLLDWSIDTLYKPKLLSYYRGSPGDTDMVRMIPVFYNIESGEEYIKYQATGTHTNPMAYEWSTTPNTIFQENAIRGYQAVEIHKCNLTTKQDDLIYRETSKTNIDNFSSNFIEPWNKIICTSERSGWKQIYSIDLSTKQIVPITNGTYYVNDILRIDTARHFILFTASGKEPNRNPYHQHLYQVHLKENSVKLLTPEDLNHDIQIEPGNNFFIDQMSTVQIPTLTAFRSIQDPTKKIEICKADVTLIDSLGYQPPQIITTIARDHKTVLYGALWKPTHFNPGIQYPIIDQTYTGPHTFMFPRNFFSALARSNQALAELGFIVIAIDGMGTANRSKAFHDVSYKNMGKNLEDHRLSILQLGRKYNWIDTTRVGIFGHSAGGFDAGHAVLEYPDFYKVAVASSADHDFRMEKDWWPEMYMGWPVDSTYHLVSNITMAGNLTGKLLITHGGIDENVNPSATFKLAEALIKADKDFDMLILPSQRHGYTGKYNEYFTKRKWNYFVEHLLNKQPVWNIDFTGTY